MKCPKCAYVGFEESDRCRHCGYEFSLSAAPPAPIAFPAPAPVAAPAPSPRSVAQAAQAPTPQPGAAITADTMTLPGQDGSAPDDLPLRAPSFPVLVHDAPPPARTPLAVRRQTSERPRSRAVAHVVRRPSSPLLEPVPDAPAAAAAEAPGRTPAPRALRLLAALLDIVLLGAIDLAVVYLTTQLAGLDLAAAVELPRVPLVAFLAGLNGGYLAVFTANGGQTLGKMATGLRVVPVTGGLSFGDAVVRVAVAVVGGLAAGAGFLPALLRADRRALHDYAAQTCVVKVQG